jgi:hypothetical protein
MQDITPLAHRFYLREIEARARRGRPLGSRVNAVLPTLALALGIGLLALHALA